MDNFIKLTEFQIQLNKNMAFQLIDLFPGNSVYDDVMLLYEKLEDEVLRAMKPRAYYSVGELSNELVKYISDERTCDCISSIYVLLTLGDAVNELSNQYLQQGDYLLGLLVNAIADTYLIQMEDILKDSINEFCASRNLGILSRLDAPVDIPMSAQKDILDEIKKWEELDIHVTKGFMYTPIKTMSYLLILTSKEQGITYAGHNCNTCEVTNCKLKQVKGV